MIQCGCFKPSVSAPRLRSLDAYRLQSVRREDNQTSLPSRRNALLGTLGLLVAVQGASAEEGNKGVFGDMRQKARALSEKTDADFESSEFLKGLRDKSDANKARYKRELQDRYCYRQAELGVGDCGGLQLIPGATKSGKQKTPEWLKGVLQKLGQLPPEEQKPATASK